MRDGVRRAVVWGVVKRGVWQNKKIRWLGVRCNWSRGGVWRNGFGVMGFGVMGFATMGWGGVMGVRQNEGVRAWM